MVIGLGSMGKRRIRLIKQIDEKIEIIGVDSNIERCKETEGKFNITTSQNMNAVDSVNCAFICTSPLSHSKIINTCLTKGWNVFTELNLVSDMYEENLTLANEKNVVLFLSSTFLYRDEVCYISDEVKASGSKVNYTYHIGQYLPDWHPWESYKNFFVGDKRSNGCREIMAIELPWITNVFGKVIKYHVISDRLTKLDIDYPDCFMIQLEHESGTKGMLTVDIVSRKAVRNLEIFGEDLYLSWDGSPKGLYKYNIASKENENISLYESVDKYEGYSAFIIENAYRKEIETFFSQIKQGIKAKYGIKQDKEVLALIDSIEGIR